MLSAEGGGIGIGIGFNDTTTTTSYNSIGGGGNSNSAGEQYRDLLYALKALELQVTVPVFFVKSLTVGLTGGTAGPGSITGPSIWDGETSPIANTPPATTATSTALGSDQHPTPPPHDPSSSSSTSLLDHQRRCQAWKDLARDSVRIDGELVSGGEVGAQGVLGAFVRHLVDKCDLLKATAAAKTTAAASTHTATTSSARSRSSNSSSNHDNSDNSDGSNGSDLDPSSPSSSSPSSSFFQLTEAAAVSLAREILSLTNRTETGGDTYFCIDSLLCATTQDRDMCILTPLGAEADPLEVKNPLVPYSTLYCLTLPHILYSTISSTALLYHFSCSLIIISSLYIDHRPSAMVHVLSTLR